ncbi:MAG: hypothetical protein ND895_01730 [Pyrinomonadaceae bacterium]|nr:hypothetical protein [Pyrinomonadaceae bacterium]
MKIADHNPRKAKTIFGRSLVVIGLFSGMTVGLVLATDASKDRAEAGEPVATPATQTSVKPRAGHSEYLAGLTRKALSVGFGKDAVLVLEPQRGPGRDAVAKQLRALAARKDGPLGARFTERGLKAARSDDRNTAFVGPFSSLKVSADGTKFHFRGNIDDPNELKRAGAAGRLIQKDELEKIGRRFIDNALKEFVRLGADESLVFLGSKYLREEALSADGKQRKDEVSANIAVFGREVRGVPVIGSGSKIAVWFANDRQPVGVDVDWATYKVTQTRQSVLSRDRLFERVRATTVPPGGTAGATVSRFECGYIDLGAPKRGAGIQSGCAIHYTGRNEDGSSWARVEYVPAGQQVFADAKWPLARLIAEGKTVNTDSPEFIRYASTRKAPGAARVQGSTGPSPE